jgi:hypothetical protein
VNVALKHSTLEKCMSTIASTILIIQRRGKVISMSQKSLRGNTKTPPDLDKALPEGFSSFILVHIIGNEANTLLKSLPTI